MELIIVFLPQEVLRINETTQVKSKPRVHRGLREVWGWVACLMSLWL